MNVRGIRYFIAKTFDCYVGGKPEKGIHLPFILVQWMIQQLNNTRNAQQGK
jgi:hypothetical protein